MLYSKQTRVQPISQNNKRRQRYSPSSSQSRPGHAMSVTTGTGEDNDEGLWGCTASGNNRMIFTYKYKQQRWMYVTRKGIVVTTEKGQADDHRECAPDWSGNSVAY